MEKVWLWLVTSCMQLAQHWGFRERDVRKATTNNMVKEKKVNNLNIEPIYVIYFFPPNACLRKNVFSLSENTFSDRERCPPGFNYSLIPLSFTRRSYPVDAGGHFAREGYEESLRMTGYWYRSCCGPSDLSSACHLLRKKWDKRLKKLNRFIVDTSAYWSSVSHWHLNIQISEELRRMSNGNCFGRGHHVYRVSQNLGSSVAKMCDRVTKQVLYLNN